MEQDVNKFTDIGSPKSFNSTSTNKTFRQLISENYTEYFSRLKLVILKKFFFNFV